MTSSQNTMSTSITSGLSISDKVFGLGSVRQNLQALRAEGFTHIHFSAGWMNTELMPPGVLMQWREDLAYTGMAVLDVHGALTRDVNLWSPDPEARALGLRLLKHRLEIAHIFHADAVVYHVPGNGEPSPAMFARLADGLARVEEQAHLWGLRIALENHYSAELARQALDLCFERFSADYIGFTLDTGHAAIARNLEWLCRNYMDRLLILHLNDNDGRHDRHWLPGASDGTVDWDLVVKSIAASPYMKPLQLEVNPPDSKQPTSPEYLRKARLVLIGMAEDVVAQRQVAAG